MPSKTATIKIRQMLRDMNLMEERKRETATQRERGTRQRAAAAATRLSSTNAQQFYAYCIQHLLLNAHFHSTWHGIAGMRKRFYFVLSSLWDNLL